MDQGITAKRDEWLQKRTTGIGGSEASAIVGCNPYMNNQQLFDLKTGRTKAPDISGKEFVKFGNDAEAPLRELFILDFPQYEVFHKEYDIRRHPEYDFILGSLDGQLTNRETGEMGVLEIKTTNILNSMHKEKWNDKIPQNYYIQILHYMLVTGYSFAILKARLKYRYKQKDSTKTDISITIKHYEIDRATVQPEIDFLLKEELKFWDYIKRDERPPLMLPNI